MKHYDMHGRGSGTERDFAERFMPRRLLSGVRSSGFFFRLVILLVAAAFATPAAGAGTAKAAPSATGTSTATAQPEKEKPPIEISAGDLEYIQPDQVVIGTGGVYVEFGGLTMEADYAEMYLDTKIMAAKGNAVLVHDGQEYDSDVMVYNFDSEIAEGLKVKTVTADQWHLAGKEAKMRRGVWIYAKNVTLTSCDHDPPHYHYHMDKMVLYNDEKILGINVTLYIGDIPVFWLPVFYQSLKDDNSAILQHFNYNEIEGWVFEFTYNYEVDAKNKVNLKYHRSQRGGTKTDMDVIYDIGKYGSGYYRATDYNETNIFRYTTADQQFLYSNEPTDPVYGEGYSVGSGFSSNRLHQRRMSWSWSHTKRAVLNLGSDLTLTHSFLETWYDDKTNPYDPDDPQWLWNRTGNRSTRIQFNRTVDNEYSVSYKRSLDYVLNSQTGQYDLTSSVFPEISYSKAPKPVKVDKTELVFYSIGGRFSNNLMSQTASGSLSARTYLAKNPNLKLFSGNRQVSLTGKWPDLQVNEAWTNAYMSAQPDTLSGNLASSANLNLKLTKYFGFGIAYNYGQNWAGDFTNASETQKRLGSVSFSISQFPFIDDFPIKINTTVRSSYDFLAQVADNENFGEIFRWGNVTVSSTLSGLYLPAVNLVSNRYNFNLSHSATFHIGYGRLSSNTLNTSLSYPLYLKDRYGINAGITPLSVSLRWNLIAGQSNTASLGFGFWWEMTDNWYITYSMNADNKYSNSFGQRWPRLDEFNVLNHQLSMYRDIHCWHAELVWKQSRSALGMTQYLYLSINIKQQQDVGYSTRIESGVPVDLVVPAS